MPSPGLRGRETSVLWMVVLLWALCESLALIWVHPLLRVGNQHVYLVSYYGLLSVSVLLMAQRVARLPAWASGVIGALTGQLLGVIALVIYGILLPDGPARFINSLEQAPLWIVIATQAWAAFLLGAWFFGAISFFAAWRICRRVTSPG